MSEEFTAAEAIETETAPVEQSTPDVDRSSEVTPRNSIDRAFEAVDAMGGGDEPAQVPKAEAGDGRARTPDGKFAPKDPAEPAEAAAEGKEDAKAAEDTSKTPANFAEPPSRFSADAKAAWATAPEPVRAEITRAVTELESGIQKYQAEFEPYKDFDKQLKEQGSDFKTVISHYTGIEQMLASNPMQGLDRICQNMGLSLRQVAEQVMGQTPDQGAAQSEGVIRELRNELASLKQELGGVSTTIKSQSEQAVMKQIEEFAADKPRFAELENDIAFFLDTGKANDLQKAYELAERLNPAPQSEAPAIAAQAATPPAGAAQPRKGNLSLSGAPSSGSNPANRKPPSTARDALDNAFAKAGL